MRHIELEAYDKPPCGGEVHARVPDQAPSPGRLPVLGQVSAAQGGVPQWQCQRCGKVWQREPWPEEVL